MKTQTELVARYKEIILATAKASRIPTVALMRTTAPDQQALAALNIAVAELGYPR